MSDLINEKKALRKLIRGRFASDDFKVLKKAVYERFEDVENCKAFLKNVRGYDEAKTIFAYLPLPDEFPTERLLEQAARDGKVVGLPVVDGENLLFRRAEFTGKLSVAEYATGSFGILEPGPQNLLLFPVDDVSTLFPLLILTPGRAFSKSGHRMGRGGGFYDKFFAQLFNQAGVHKSKITTVGICYDIQIVSEIPTEPTDLPVDDVVTN